MAKGITVPVTQTGLEQSIQGAAKKVGSISIPIDVDAKSFKNLSQPLGRITGLATEFEKSIAASNARVIAFGASVGIINGVQNALASLVTTTIEVQKNLTSIGVILGKTNEELGSFSKGLFAVARETAQSFQTASEAALEFSRQGLSTEETLKRTKDALTLTRFTSLSAADAVDVLTAAVNSFSSSGVTTAEILNKLVAVDTRFAVSSEDLAKGLSRAGSIAQEVGVSLDELNAIVTVVQEKTARGGAVIGNAFKTIFTRIRSKETINALQEIGIFSRDASGNLRPVVDILTQLAGKLSSLSEVQKIEVLEAIASKYNINSLNSLLDDLSSSSSKFQEIAGISANANNEAYTRQVELNKTLDATIKQTVVSVAELANSIGKIGVTANLQSLLEFFNDVISGINSFIDSESIGGDIAKGLISGISGVLFKIGLPILGAIFIKLTKDIAQFGVESLKTILGINQQVKERQALEQAVVNTLIRDRDVMAAILALSGDRTKQEEYLLNLYNRQIAALQQVQSIAGAVAPGLVQAGLSATSGSVQKKAGRAAEGYLPAQEAADVKRGVGGADKNAKVVKIPNFSFGGGKKGTMYANSSEYVVPNYNGGDGSAIFNKDMVRKYGMPENAKKINAATGYIPNFAQKIQAETSEAQAEQKDSITIADARGRSAMLVPDKKNERIMEAYLDKPLSFGFQTKDKGKKLGVDYVKYHTYGLNQEAFKAEGLKKSGDLTNIEADVQAFGLDIAKKYSYEYAGEYSKSLGGPATGIQISDADVRKAFLASKGAVSGFSSLGGGIFETAIRTGVQGEINKDLLKAQQAELGSGKLDFKVTDIIKRLFGVNRGETDADSKIEGNPKSTGRAFADQIAANNLYSSTNKVAIQNAAAGYIPNYINNQPKNIKAIREGNKFERYLNLKLFGQEEDAGSAVLDFPKKTGFGKDPEIRKKLGINPVSQYGDAKRTRSKKSEKSLLDKYLRTEEGKQEFLKAQPLGKLINLNPAGLSMLFLNEGQDSKSFAKVETTEAILSEKTKELIKQKFPNTRASKIITMSYIADKINKDAVFGKKASMGYVPNYANKLSEMYDWDGTIIPRISGKPEEYIQSLQKLEKKDLLPIGKELASSKEKFDIATGRPIAFREPIKQTAQRLGLNVERIFPLGSMFENRRTMGVKGKPRKLYGPERKALFAEKTGRSIVDNQEDVLAALGSRGIDANLRNRASFGFIPNFASQNAIDAMRRIISDPAAPQGEKDAASLKLSQLTKASSSKNPKTTAQKTAKTKLPITQEDKDYLNQNKEKIVAGMGRSFGMLFNLDALEMGDLGYVKRLDPIVAKKLSEIAQKQGGRDSIRSLVDFGSAAKGYIPNFADPLKEAVDREISAGIKPSQVRITQDDRLMTTRNPEGIAVINTKDEPNGKVPSNRINEKNGRKAAVAMAAKGFIPNFAGEGKVKFNVGEVSPGEQKVPSFEKLKTELNALAEEFKNNAKSLDALDAATAQFKDSLKALANKYKNAAEKEDRRQINDRALNAETEKLIASRKKQLTITANPAASNIVAPVNPTNVGSAGGGGRVDQILGKIKNALGGKQGGDPNAPKQFDAGKFLLMQSAVVGATSALQAFTEEGSKASLAIEAAGGVLSSAATFVSLKAAGMGPVGVAIGVATTALTSLIPVISKLTDSLKTEEQRIVDSLSKLGEEARKTGESVTPEKFLAAFEKTQANERVKKREEPLFEAISDLRASQEKYGVKGSGSALEKEQINALFAGASAAGLKAEDIKSTFGEKGTIQGIDVEKALDDFRLKALQNIEKKEREIALSRQKRLEENAEIIKKTIEIENQQINKRLAVQQKIFDLEMQTTKTYADRTLLIDKQLAALESGANIKGTGSQRTFEVNTGGRPFITEREFLNQQSQLEVNRAEAERTRDASTVENAVFAELKGLQGIGKLFGDINTAGLISQFEQGGNQVSGIGVRTQDNKQMIGGIDVNALQPEQKEQIANILLKASQARAKADQDYATKRDQITQKAALELTETEKLTRDISALQASLNKGTVFEEKRGIYTQGLSKSLLEQQQKNNIILASSDEYGQYQLDVANENATFAAQLRAKIGIEKRAETDAINFQAQNDERIDTIRKEIENIQLLTQGGRDLFNAETKRLEAENRAYASLDQTVLVDDEARSVTAKLIQSERQAEIQNKANIATIGQKVQNDENAIRRSAELLKAENDLYEKTGTKTLIQAEYSLALQKLTESERQATVQNEVNVQLAGKKLDADINAIKRQVDLTEATNKAFDQTKKDNMFGAKLSLARANLTKSLDEAEVENRVAIEMIRDNFNADSKLLDGKIKLAKSTNDLILQTDYNALVSKELTLEYQNLVGATRKARARLTETNLAIGADVAGERIKGQQSNAVADIMNEGQAYKNLRFGRGTFEAQAKAAIAQERMGGRTGEEVSSAEQYEIANGINNSVGQNLKYQRAVLLDQADTFQDIIGKQTPQLFADGMAQAMEAALSQADDLGSALRGVAMGFLKSLQGAFLQSASKQIVASVLPNALPFSKGGMVKGYATGGLVTGGSGYKDDVPAMLSEGEYVIRKSSVQKYGKDNLTKLNSGKMPTMADGGFFLPGFRGQESISGIENLQKFASQTTTSGATDVMKGSASSAFINLEDQSMRLSRFALLGDDTINQEIRDAQQSALDAIEKRRQYDLQKKEESKQFKKQIIGTVLSAALSYGVSSFLKPAAAAAAIPNIGFNPGELSGSLGSSALEGINNNLGQNFANLGQSAAATTSSITGNFLDNSLNPPQIGSPLQQYNNPVTSVSNKYKPLRGVTPFSFPGRAYGGQVARYAAGGGTKDDVPALLMGGEYVMSNQATKKYGKQFFDSINQGRAPRFAAGGEVGGGEMLGEKFDNLSSKLETRGAPEVNITVNVTSSGASETKSQGESNQGGIDYKKMSERIKAVVIETINEEKRLGGSLRPRG
jgi:TP901 family phage tail tape measure protein